ncbi:LuxR C-terminal-related transcriptional regulator [Microbacterium schleiferi]|uniref:LuxR C-terminal-related transcriptional regulator n=1 Tax=Microbacterium schleiferi TaxID=69362 RepID=A0ABU7V4D9_9MICO
MGLAGVPRLPGALIDRARLEAVLEEDYGLGVLCAPAGMGKTVAMAQWAARTPRRGLWLRVTDGGGSPTVFAGHLALALHDYGLLDSGNPLAAGPAAFQFVAEPWDTLRRGLARLGELALAIDESEYLEPDTVSGVIRLLNDLPSLSVRTTTRVANGFVEPALTIALDVVVLRDDELALTRGETAALLHADEDTPIVSDVLDHGGAPGLARLLTFDESATGGRGGDRTLREIDSSRVSEIVDSFLRIRRPSWDSRFIDFLEAICLADAVDIELAVRLTGEADAAALLDRAEREGLGQWRGHGSHGLRREAAALFEPSPFAQRALSASARRNMQAERLRELELSIARWESEHGRPFEALRRATTQRDWPFVTDIVRRSSSELLPYGGQISQLFRDVPLTTLGRLPLVTTLLALIANARPDHRLRALEYFLLAAYGSRQRSATRDPADRVLLGTLESVAQRVSGRDGGKAARKAFDTIEALSPSDRSRLGRNEPSVWNQIGTSLLYSGDVPRAIASFRQAIAASDAGGYRAGLQGLALLAGTHALNGEMTQARAVADRAEAREWPDRWKTGYPGSFLQLAHALIALESGDAATAQAHLHTLDEHRETIEHWAPLLHVDVLIELRLHRADTARERIRSIASAQRARRAVSHFTGDRLRHTSALAALAAGDLSGAERILGRAGDPRTAVSRARIALTGDDPERALRLLTAAPGEAMSARTRAEHLALTAAAVAVLGQDDAHARAANQRADAALAENAQMLALALVPDAALEKLATSAHRLAQRAFARRVERARGWGMIPSPGVAPRLTSRELAVASELGRHEGVSQIAAALNVSPNTVKSQLRALYRKLGVNTRTDALRVLAAWGLVRPGVDTGFDDLAARGPQEG